MRGLGRDDVRKRFGIDLLPCGFCGNLDVGMPLSADAHVSCPRCHADGPIPIRGNRENAIHAAANAWNNRVVISK